MRAIPQRGEVDKKHTWNAESVFPTPEAWEAERESILNAIPGVKDRRGRMGAGPGDLADALSAVEELGIRAARLMVYASLSHSADTTDGKAAAMNDKAQSVLGLVGAAVSFVKPELLAVGEETLRRWAGGEPRLVSYLHYFDDLFRRRAHVRSGEVEELLGMLADPFSGPSNTAAVLTNADFTFAAARGRWGRRIEVTQGTLVRSLESRDGRIRRSGWMSYMDRYVEFKNTLASNLITSIKQSVFRARARGHGSALAASLFPDNIPEEVFHNVVAVFRKNLPIWHRYFEVRSRALRLKDLNHCDMWAPLTRESHPISYGRAVEMICEGLEPLGAEYAEAIRRGCEEDRWVDVYPNRGKKSGAFSWGVYGTHPFVMMSYTSEVSSLSTLAHELGHSMHSYLTWKNQPIVYSEYSMFAAEVASNFHQAMVRASLLARSGDAGFRISLLEEAMQNFFRYLFIMPTLARFELEVHGRAEAGEALTAEAMIDVMSDLLAEGYGGRVTLDLPRDGMLWATFPHLFEDYYVFQYVTGISGAHALSSRVLRGVPGAVDEYLAFLASGSSMYPLDALKKAGVDLGTPGPIEETFAVMNGYVEELEKLVG